MPRYYKDRIMSTDEQKDAWAAFIESRPHLTVAEMAKALNISYSLAYGLCQDRGLKFRPVRRLRTSRSVVKAGIFNEMERQNWLV